MNPAILEKYSGELLDRIRELHFSIRDTLIEQKLEAKRKTEDSLSEIHSHGSGDVVYAIDAEPERMTERFFEKLGREVPLVLVTEASGKTCYPKNVREEECEIRVIVDPIDGTRPLMYDIDSAYILTGIAPNRGDATGLCDIEIAVQTEIPTTRQYLSDFMYAFKSRGEPVIEEWNILSSRLEGKRKPSPSRAKTLEHGFVSFANYFRSGKTLLSEIEDKLYRELLGPVKKGTADVFEHQYISSAGQLAYLINGKYRLAADFRSLAENILIKRGESLGLCAHPYDLCTKLIAEKSGIMLTDLEGYPLDAPLDTKTNIGWIGYANKDIRNHAEDTLLGILESFYNK